MNGKHCDAVKSDWGLSGQPCRMVVFRRGFSWLSETFIYDYIREAEKQGQEVFVVCFNRANETERPLSNVWLVRDFSCRNLVAYLKSFRPALFVRFFRDAPNVEVTKKDFFSVFIGRLRWAYRRYILYLMLKKIKPDVIHAHFGHDGVAIISVAEALKVPLVTTFHGMDFSVLGRFSQWKRRYKRLFAAAARIIGVSDFVCERLLELGAPKEKLLRIYCGIDLKRFPYSDPAERFDGRNVYCLFVGRLVEKKGPLQLISAFARAREKVEGKVSLHLTIIGDGPMKAEIEAKIEFSGLKGSVWLMGSVPHSEISGYLEHAHIFVQPSCTASSGDQEGLPVSIMEAFASGLPVVSTFHSGIPEIVADGVSGYLSREYDMESFTENLTRLALNPRLWTEFGRTGRKKVEEFFDLSKQTAAVIDILKKTR